MRWKIGELLYINFLYEGMYNIVIYPEELNTYNSFFRCAGRTKMSHIYQRLLKEVNVDHDYFRCPDL